MIEMGLIKFLDISGDLESPGIGAVGVSSSAEEYRESSEMVLEIGEEHLKSRVSSGVTALFVMGELIDDSWWFYEEYLVISMEYLLKDFSELVLSWSICVRW